MTARGRSRLAGWLLRWLAPAEWRESIGGDLEEERRRRLAADQTAGWLWEAGAVLGITLPLVVSRMRAAAVRPRTRAPWFESISTDLAHARRGLVASPGYTLTAAATLAIGIGANAAVFNLAHWLLLRPVPGIADQASLVAVGYGMPDGARGPVSLVDLQDLAAGMPALGGLAGYQSFQLHLAPPGGVARRVDAEVVTGNYFDVLGGPMALGRGFTRAEGAEPGGPATAVISHRLWRTALGGSPGVLGGTMTVNGSPFTVVGVAARGFHGATRAGAADLWVPITQHATAIPSYPPTVLTNRSVRLLFGMVGRLRAGASPETAAAQAEAVRARLAAEYPGDRRLQRRRFDVRPGIEARPWIIAPLTNAMTVLMGVVSLLLLLACANVANLMVVRASGRRSEVAMRLALGASRTRVIRLLLAESLLLSLAAGLAAVGVTMLAGRALEGTIVLRGLPPLDRIEINWTVLGFALAVSALVAVAAGLVPAIRGSRVPLSGILRDAGRTATPARQRLRRALTALQVAVSVILLVGAALLARSTAARLAIDPGFDSRQVLSFSIEPGLQGYGSRQQTFYRELLDRVRRVPGVRAAGLAWLQPFSQGAADTSFRPEGADPDTVAHSADLNAVSPGFFHALGIRVVSGREFTDAEFQRPEAGGNGVVMLTASLARRVFGDAPAAGRRVVMTYPEGVTRTVVGVVEDARLRRLTDDEGTLFEPFGQTFPSGWASVVVGLGAPGAGVLAGLRSAVAELDATLPIYDVVRLDDAIRRQFADDLLVARLAGAFALLAAILATVGLYGVLAREVADRGREIGIRTALGATPARLVRLVAGDGLRMFGAGLAVGLPASWWLTRFIESRLYGVEPLDPASLAIAVGSALLLTLLAGVPAVRRALRTDPACLTR